MEKRVILATKEYNKWYAFQDERDQYGIERRIETIGYENYFDDIKIVDKINKIGELRWRNGRRIYFTVLPGNSIILLLGGNKNGQKKDIKKAASIARRINVRS